MLIGGIGHKVRHIAYDYGCGRYEKQHNNWSELIRVSEERADNIHLAEKERKRGEA